MRLPVLLIKKTKKGWAWNAIAKNGKVVGNGESFKTKAAALKGAMACKTILIAAPFRFETHAK